MTSADQIGSPPGGVLNWFHVKHGVEDTPRSPDLSPEPERTLLSGTDCLFAISTGRFHVNHAPQAPGTHSGDSASGISRPFSEGFT